MVNATESVFSETSQRSILTRFLYIREKSSGNSKGFVAKKLKKSNIKPGDNKSGKKYDYEWMIKSQHPVENIASILSSNIARIFLGDDCAPKEHLLDTNNSSGEYIRSRFLESFQDLTNDFEKSGDIEMTFSVFFQNTKNALDLKVFNLLIANHDDNIGNVGRIFEKGEDCKAGIIDLSQSLLLYDLSPDDSIRSQINTNYQKTGFKIAIMQEEFVDALDNVIESFEDVVISHLIRSTLTKNIESLINYNSRIVKEFFNKNINMNICDYKEDPSFLAETIYQKLKERCEALKNLRDILQIEWAIINNDLKSIPPILKKNQALSKREKHYFPILGMEIKIADYVLNDNKPKVIEKQKNSIRKLF